ncbi:MAG: T9SS type A sorting domain-containing protein, partial [Flavobacteriales bacterium]|nr:T9SS type A sorting domain-containing protein [Flavobacteriales bacterium]
PFIDVPAGVELVVGIAPGNSASADDAIATFPFTLDTDGKYIIVANGIVSASGYNPAQPFTLSVSADAREEAMLPTNTDVLVMHGSTDAPVVDVAEISVPAGTVVNDLAYGSFAGYLELGTADYALQVQTSTGTPVVTYSAPLATLGLDGAALTVVASGFLAPANNSNGPAFGLYVALPAGGDLIPLPVITNVGLNEVDDAITFNAWPNPANDVLNVSIDATEANRATVTLTDMTGRTALELPTAVINAGENRMTIDVAALAAGFYTISVASNQGIRTSSVQVVR